MKPIKSQVSFSKERNFSFLRKSDSLKEKKEDESDKEKEKESKKKKEKERAREKKKSRRKSRSREGSANRDSGIAESTSPFDDIEYFTSKLKNKDRKESSHQITNALASSIAATLSPFSSLVASKSPKNSRRTSPCQGSTDADSLSLPKTPKGSSPKTSTSKSSSSSKRNTSPTSRPPLITTARAKSFNYIRDQFNNNSVNSQASKPSSTCARTNSFQSTGRKSWGGVTSSLSCNTNGSSSSPSPSPGPSSPSLSPGSSRSESSSSVSEDENQTPVKKPNRFNFKGTRPKIRVSSEDSSEYPGDDQSTSCSTASSSSGSSSSCSSLKAPPRFLPYRIEEGWERNHSTDIVAKHR